MTFSRSNVGTRDMSRALSQLYSEKSQKPSDKSFFWGNVPGYGARALEAADERTKEELMLGRKACVRAAACQLTASAVPRPFGAVTPSIRNRNRHREQLVSTSQQAKATATNQREFTHPLGHSKRLQTVKKAMMVTKKQKFTDRTMGAVTPMAQPVAKANSF